MTTVRNVRVGSSHSQSATPATITASTIRSSRSSSRAPRSVARHCSRAVSPSTPSRIDAACTKMPPTTARDADNDHAAHSPTSAVNIENAAGGMRAGASAMVIRVEIGRLTNFETGPSTGLASERRSRCLAARRSYGVSTSCHQPPSGRWTARIGPIRPSAVTAPAREWSPRAEVTR